MKINLKSIASLTAKSALKWSVIFIPGLILSVIFFSIALYLLYNGDTTPLEGTGRIATHGGSSAGLAVFYVVLLRLALADPFPMLLAIMSSSVMLYVYFALASKFTLSAAFFNVWNSNLSNWFSDKLAYYTNKATTQSNTIKKIDIATSKKLQIIQTIQKDKKTSKWQKKLLTFVMKKINLEDADFLNPETKFSDILQEKIKKFATNMVKPSKKIIYIAYTFHILLLILAIVYDN